MEAESRETGGRVPRGTSANKLVIGIRDSVMLAGWFIAIAWVFAIYFPGSIGLPPDQLDGRGNAVAALFSGLAFVGVVAAIFLQRELRLQRQS